MEWRRTLTDHAPSPRVHRALHPGGHRTGAQKWKFGRVGRHRGPHQTPHRGGGSVPAVGRNTIAHGAPPSSWGWQRTVLLTQKCAFLASCGHRCYFGCYRNCKYRTSLQHGEPEDVLWDMRASLIIFFFAVFRSLFNEIPAPLCYVLCLFHSCVFALWG